MKHNNPAKVWEWLQTMPTIEELCAEYPGEWDTVQRELSTIFESGKPEDLKAYLERSPTRGTSIAETLHRSQGDRKKSEAVLSQFIRNRMAYLVLKNYSLAAATGVTKGKVRFNLLNGYIVQKLLFFRKLERKPVSLFWFRLIWPLIWQKRMLMPLVQPKGIYCFYSRPLVEALARMIASRPCLELAAGDGALSRFLKDLGVQVTATDNYSWKHAVQYPEWVIKQGAQEALSLYAPEVVICSWPPANNNFERQVFMARTVQLYIVISSRHQFASGNWDDYRHQTTFTLEEDKTLGRLVLPPELDATVYIFRRKPHQA